jgi:hypothetical protein
MPARFLSLRLQLRAALAGAALLASFPLPAWDDPVAPEVKKVWEEILDSARPIREKESRKQLETLIAGWAGEHRLEPERVARLKRAASIAAKQHLESWEESLVWIYTATLAGPPERAVERLRNVSDDLPTFFGSYNGDYRRVAANRPVWLEAAKAELPAKVFQAWHKELTEELDARETRTLELVETGLEQQWPGARLDSQATSYIAELKPQLEGDTELIDRLTLEIKALEGKYREECKESSIRRLNYLNQDGQTWPRAESQGWYLDTLPVDSFLEKHRSELEEKVLSQEQRDRINASRRQLQERLSSAASELLVLAVLHAVPLTAEQHESLLTAATSSLKDGEAKRIMELRYDFNPLDQWGKAPLKSAIKKTLDEHQRALLSRSAAMWNSSSNRGDDGAPAPPPRSPRAPPIPEEALAAMISNTMHHRSRSRVPEMMLPFERRIDEAVRIGGLEPEARDRLLLVAKGAAQSRIEQSRQNLMSYLASQTRGLAPEDIPARLESIGNISFGMPDKGDPLQSALASMLGKDGQRRLQEHRELEKERRHRAIALMERARQDQALHATPRQHEELLAAIVAALETHGDAIDKNFQRWGERKPWFFQSHQLCLAAAGVPEEGWKKILSEEQQDVWEDAVVSNAQPYWEQIEQAKAQFKP